jgi:methylmalonyl-CoA/ethylmalonyl-CoA epimerase
MEAIVFKRLDHLAIVVPNTEAALLIWRDKFGLPVLFSETINNGSLRLTHLDLGNTNLQLVEPLTSDHPLAAWLAAHGPGLHHFCFGVDDVAEAFTALPAHDLAAGEPQPHQGTQGKRALFLDRAGTQTVQVELTGK